MRVIVLVMTLLAVAPISSQTSAPQVYGLDPYKPSDAELLRKYGSTLVAQTPLLELAKLDPYKPSHAALLRDIGGAIPWWGLWYPYQPTHSSLVPFPATGRSTPAPNVLVFFVGRLPAENGPSGSSPTAAAPPSSSTSIATTLRPESNDGVWISYAGQRWISAGEAVPFSAAEFTRVGQYGRFPVYQRARVSGAVIYLPTREELVAPYRLKP